MKTLESNIISIHKERGKEWLKNLPNIVRDLANKYNLSELKPVENLSYNYVMLGLQGDNPIVLKVGPDIKYLEREADALKAYQGFGAVDLIAQDKGVLLLDKVNPGYSLKSIQPLAGNESVKIMCHVTKKLHQAPIPKKHHFPHITEWLSALDKEWDMPENYLIKARALRDKLLKKPMKEVLLHGDLHHDNILQSGEEEWLVIDPKGVIGYPINEVWAFVMDMENDTKFISEFFNFKLQDVREWYFVHLILSVCWNLEDNIDPKFFLSLAEKAYLMLP